MRKLCHPLGVGDFDFYRDVRRIGLFSTLFSKRGHERYQPVSSHGTLQSGERYFIYRFLLFWDGFEISSGKSASGEGFYMICLNLPPNARSSSSAVRIITQTPPGVKIDSVFKNIQNDIVKGMTIGFLDYDAYGNSIRIFLDLVGFIGDTPAINSALDVLGHTGGACCHLCKFFRHSHTIVGSRYAHSLSHGLSAYAHRGVFQHRAVRDSEAKTETCRLLGMSSSDPLKPLPLHDLRLAMISCQPHIPKTEAGAPLLSGHLDPYRSCLIGPDHLLTGHFRDCVNAAFRLLPTNEHRKSVEMYMIGFLADCKLPTQNRLFDMKKKSLFAMSMTDLYALSVVAHHGFLRGCKAASLSVPRRPLSRTCIDAIGTVQSCSLLICRLWDTDSIPRTNAELGSSLTVLHEMTFAHLLRIQELCKMTDEEVLSLENSDTSRVRRAELVKKRRECLIVIKAIDKPNIHRLHELVNCTIPMVGHVSRIGELVLEKAHQTLKRAIRLSNNKEVQIQSILSAVFNDWQGRLSMQVPSAMQSDQNAIRGCLRLLSGREAIQSLSGKITEHHEKAVLRALGPDCCVPSLLFAQAKSVLAPKANCKGPAKWCLEGNKEVARDITAIFTQERSMAFSLFSNMCHSMRNALCLVFCDTIRTSYPNGMSGIVLSYGDILDVPCHSAKDISAQYPIVAQPHWVSQSPTNPEWIGSLFCCVTALFSRVTSAGLTEFWAAVYPCEIVPSASPPSRVFGTTEQQSSLYTLHRTLSFVELNSTVRKAARIPLCENISCAPSLSRSCIIHGSNCDHMRGTKFYILSKTEGYPPRQG